MFAPTSPPATPSRPRHRGRVVAARALAATLSLAAGLVGAELLVGAARDFAFPYLNIYEADPVYGVRLEPDASTAIRSPDGRVTDIRTNALGFRGPDWRPAASDAPVPGRVLLLGDSQVFGYGVDEPDALAARLTAHLAHHPGGADVLNAATPTWGPPEMLQALAQHGAAYRPERVVFVANVVNDWFETGVPNVRRTTARDGWASFRLDPDAPPPSDSPVRRFLLGRSHLVYAVRALVNAASDDVPPATAASTTRLLDNLDALARPDGPFRSRLGRHVLAARQACRRLGCRVLVAVLPIDAQVHPSEWAKYGEPPRDTSALAALADGLLADARALDVAALDLTPVLAAASPGAFLPDDYHLSPRGHDAVARALATALAPESTP